MPEQHPDSISSKVYEMPEVIVTAKRWEWILDNRPLSGEIFKIRAIDQTSDLGAIIKSMVNADVVSYGGEGSSKILSLRGASPEQTLFLLDGDRINTAQGNNIDLALLPLSWIEQIEVYRAGSAIEMGTQAIGGVVNIITKQEKKTHQHFSIRLGSENLLDINSFSSLNFFRNLNLWAGVQAKKGSDDFWYLDENRDTVYQRENTDFKNAGGLAKLKYSFSNNSLELNFNANTSDRGAPGLSEFPTPDARLNDKAYIIQTKLEFNKAQFLYSETRAYINWFTRSYFNPQPVIYTDDTHKNIAFGIDEKIQFLLSPNFKIFSGIELRKDSLSSTTDGECKRQSIGTFLQSELLFGDEKRYILLQPGARIEWVGDFESQICPGLGIVYKHHKGMVLKTNVERTFRPPGFDDLFWPTSAMAVGNPELLPEDAVNIDLGIILYPYAKNLRISFTGFHRKVNNLIEWTPGAKGVWRPHNVGKAVIKGIETEISYLLSLTEKVLFEIVSNYTYTSARDLTLEPNRTGNQLVRKPKHKANLQIYLSISEKYQISNTWHYVGLRYTTSANTKWLPAYMNTDCNILYQLNKNISFSLAVNNIMDKQYIDVTGFPIPGRRWYVKTSFGF